ncbi:MAG: hypothetical protein L0229_27925 [Blastocatellia bacterium]|nr:hypothetical protein [Blastocatellia bacterium]
MAAALVDQPYSLAQNPNLSGGGLTKDPVLLSQNEVFESKLIISLDKEDAEKVPFVEADEEFQAVSATAAAAAVPRAFPILPGGIDHAAAGTGTANAGFGTIRMRGVPPGSMVVRAFLYWGTITNNPTLTATAIFNGVQVTGTLIGSSPQLLNCYLPMPGGPTFAVYRAGVRTLVPPAINVDYSVNGLASAVTNGGDPFSCTFPFSPPQLPFPLGASLVILYSHSSIPAASRTYLHQGVFTVTGNVTFTHNLNPALPSHNLLKSTRLGGDGQAGCSLFSVGTATGERTSIGDNLSPLTQIKGSGSTFNTDGDFNGYDGASLNQLWDTHTDSFGAINGAGTLITPGVSQYLVQFSAVGDCFVPIVFLLTVR